MTAKKKGVIAKTFDRKRFLGHLIAVVEKHGWLARGRAKRKGEASSSARALANMERGNALKVTEGHYEKADKLIAWSVKWKPEGDFDKTVKTISAKSKFTESEAHTVAPIVRRHKKATTASRKGKHPKDTPTGKAAPARGDKPKPKRGTVRGKTVRKTVTASAAA